MAIYVGQRVEMELVHEVKKPYFLDDLTEFVCGHFTASYEVEGSQTSKPLTCLWCVVERSKFT